MPIVVDEVVISVEVTGGAPPADASKNTGANGERPASAGDDRQRIVDECVERVLDILARRRGAVNHDRSRHAREAR